MRKRGRYTSGRHHEEENYSNALEISPEQASSEVDKEFVDRSIKGTYLASVNEHLFKA